MSAKYFPKKFFTLLLFIVFMSGLIPAAQADSYNLWVGGVEVTSDNYSDSNNKWSYSATNHTLTLKGFTYTDGTGHENTGIYYSGADPLNIVLTGTNTITMNEVSAGKKSYGIYINKNTAKLTFSGDGSLSVTGGNSTQSSTSSYGIYCDSDITVNSGTLTATGGNVKDISTGINCVNLIINNGTVKATGGAATNSYGIYGTNNMTVQSGTVEAESGTVTQGVSSSYGSYGIRFNGSTITVSGGQVTGTGGTANGTNGESYGIYCNDATMTVNGGTITATGGSANNHSRGIHCKNMTIESGTINATGGSSSNDDSHGISFNYGTMTVKGGTVTATGGQGKAKSYGIECSGNMDFTGGTIIAEGGDVSDSLTSNASYGIYCNADIRVNGATVTGTAGNAPYSRGIYCKNFTIDNVGSKVTGTGGNAGINCYSGGTMTITNGEVTATGTKTEGDESYGIQCDAQQQWQKASVRLSSTNYSLTINGGKLTAIGEKQAINVANDFTTSIAGTGWTDTAGTTGKDTIPTTAGKDDISSYKKIVFQAQQSSAPSNPGGGSGGGQSTTGYEVIDTDTKNNTQTTTTDVTVRGNLSGTNIVEVIQQIESTTEVKTLDLSNVTGVTEVKLPENTKIETLTITENNSIKKVEVSNNDSLKTINLSGSKIEAVNASECSGLETVEVENNTSLVTLNVSYSSVTILNAKNCVNLETLNCERCEIRDLNIEGCQKLWGLDCSYNNLTRLDVSAFSNLSSLACQGQIVRGFKRVQSFNLIDFLFRKTSEFFLADYTEEELKELDYVHNLKAFDEAGNEIQVNSDEQGNLTFSKIPAKITYDYDTGFNNIVMDVTVETAEDESGEEDGSGKVSGSGGSGGGCNSNFGFAALAVLLKFCSRNSLRKSRKRT